MDSLSHTQSFGLHTDVIVETSPALVILRKCLVEELYGFLGLRWMVNKIVVEEMGLEVVVAEAKMVLYGKIGTC